MNLPLNTLADPSDRLEQARYNMIEQQVRPWDVSDAQVLEVMQRLHREDFVPAPYRDMAFTDMEIPLHDDPVEAIRLGQIMLAPRVEARMLQDLKLKASDRVLEIGAGSGFMAAMLASLTAEVTSLEIEERLVRMASTNLAQAGITNARVLHANGAEAIAGGPYDVVVLSGSVAHVPQPLLDLLAPGGRLGAIVGFKPMMRATFMERSGKGFGTTEPWDVVTARLRHFPQPSQFKF
ncbi:protein-L-isoaspartate O-methyltransferase [Comamonas sp. NLF-1-9]|uniref:protein-L-isoaspartate O-methyltransferase family protein n=1 Tax=Comamonas sp. NLF-1-9 TaxID=2853163 RepID=UPI001C452647|nr:protein-L-isoaspartate O-methyltransferase [Comamonas sp. NLF-1-9]QXL83261.1 protein-L-isoaspartate O-methyltransferase [Comamonas sp. NLF-1-9]